MTFCEIAGCVEERGARRMRGGGASQIERQRVVGVSVSEWETEGERAVEREMMRGGLRLQLKQSNPIPLLAKA